MAGNDDNDRLRAGSLPEDPFEGQTVSEEVPHILCEPEMLGAAGKRAFTRDKRVYGTTGHFKLDAITGGLRPGDCWLVGADTSWGKSSFAIMLYDENAKRGKRTLIVSAEDSESTYGDRLLCRRSRVPAQALRDRHLSRQHQEAIAQAQRDAKDNPVFIDARGKTVEWLQPRIKRAVKEHRIDVVVFDYIGAFANKVSKQDRRNDVTYIARVMTDIAKTCVPGGICGVLLSQLTMNDDEQIPGKYAFRDSKDLPQMAEVVLIGFLAPKDDSEHGVAKGDKVIKVAKCKQGQAGKKIVMAWNPEVACFDAVHNEEQRRYDQLSEGMQDWNESNVASDASVVDWDRDFT